MYLYIHCKCEGYTKCLHLQTYISTKTIALLVLSGQQPTKSPYRWSPASLTINIYFYLFSYLYITRITINNGTPHLKSLESQNRRAALGWTAIKLLGAFTSLRWTNPRPWFCLGSSDKTIIYFYLFFNFHWHDREQSAQLHVCRWPQC